MFKILQIRAVSFCDAAAPACLARMQMLKITVIFLMF